MRCRQLAPLFALALVSSGLAACSAPTPSTPLSTVSEVLALHGMLGRQPEDRSPEAKRKDPPQEKLATLFADLGTFDPFLADLYRGFVLSVLARNQAHLVVTTSGARSTVQAGRVNIVLRQEQGRWRIVLTESVPAEIRTQAAYEQRRFEEAKAQAAKASVPPPNAPSAPR